MDRKDGGWAIEARAFMIPYTPFSHNFWVLADGAGRVAGQLHGLAVDPDTGESRAVGSSRDLLQAVDNPAIAWSRQPGQPRVVCAAGAEEELRRRWQCARDAIPAMNALRIAYPNFWQHFYRLNSNSVFNTFGHILGFGAPDRLLPTLAPGIRLVVSAEIIEHYGYKGSPARRKTRPGVELNNADTTFGREMIMATVETKYLGDLRTESVHLQSGSRLLTDAPVDNQGRGEAFSPTDLVATAYGACVLTIMGIAAKTHGFDIDGAEVATTKVMGTDPRRIVELAAEFTLPHNNYSAKERKIIELAAKECPVYNSLHPDLKKTIVFKYKG